VHAAALDVRARRTELIANNLANADTPGYQAATSTSARPWRVRRASAHPGRAPQHHPGRHIGGNASADADANPDLKYRTPLAPALDGNTVDAQLEQAALRETRCVTRRR
jgi:flagellar basal-body rod protein FlgB